MEDSVTKDGHVLRSVVVVVVGCSLYDESFDQILDLVAHRPLNTNSQMRYSMNECRSNLDDTRLDWSGR